MNKVKVLYVRNLTQDISEEKLKESFEQFGKVERVKKIKDYAFVHFEDRDHAVLAMRDLNGKELGCSNIEVCLEIDFVCNVTIILTVSSVYLYRCRWLSLHLIKRKKKKFCERENVV